jgi:hypothetical protein
MLDPGKSALQSPSHKPSRCALEDPPVHSPATAMPIARQALQKGVIGSSEETVRTNARDALTQCGKLRSLASGPTWQTLSHRAKQRSVNGSFKG